MGIIFLEYILIHMKNLGKKEDVLYFRPYVARIFPSIGLQNKPHICLVPPMNRFLKWPLIKTGFGKCPMAWGFVSRHLNKYLLEIIFPNMWVIFN